MIDPDKMGTMRLNWTRFMANAELKEGGSMCICIQSEEGPPLYNRAHTLGDQFRCR